MSSHNYAIEHGRHTNTHIDNRYSELSHLDIVDFNFVLKCLHFHDIRCENIKKCY